MPIKKIVILLLAFLFPVCIFLFLKFFGKNEFTVPPLYEKGIDKSIPPCGHDSAKPYRISENEMARLTRSKSASLYVVNFSNDKSISERIINEAPSGQVTIVSGPQLQNDQIDLANFKSCVLLLQEPNDLVLVDNERRIRGYYDSKDRDEVDRLLVEISIILKDY